jgi:cytochrome c oxidase subunit 6b
MSNETIDPWAGRTGDGSLEQLRNDPDNFKPTTAPFDPRFPTTNQTRNCWQNYVDYHKCVLKKGEEYEPCAYFKRVYKALCPMSWVETWDDQMKEKRFVWEEGERERKKHVH